MSRQMTLPESATEVRNGRLTCDADTPVVYVARRHTAIFGVFGTVTDAEAAVKAHREEGGHNHEGYVVDLVPFFGRLWRPGRGESET